MTRYTCILVDDEQHCLDLLHKMIEAVLPNELEIIASFTKPLEALKFINANKPDVLFCDIEMPKLSGIDLVNTLDENEIVTVFATAYNQYAIEAIKLSAVDYLVKPFGTEDIIAAFALIKKRMDNTIVRKNTSVQTKLKIILPNGESKFIDFTNIACVEASSNYSIIHLKDNTKFTQSKTLKEFDDILCANGFFRTHHSFLVNLAYVDTYKGGLDDNVSLKNGMQVSVSRRRKADFLLAMKTV
jgi:two-component system, LytTR family, response regulator